MSTQEMRNVSGEREVGFGIVGCGVIAPWHYAAIARATGGRLVACADVIEERAHKAAQGYVDTLNEYGITKNAGNDLPAVYSDYHQLLQNPDVDVVCVCVPSGDHAKVGIDAAKAKKHVISEKPLDITLAKMDAFIGAAKENNVHLAAIFQRRFDANAKRLKAAIDEGRFGKIVQADCSVKWYRSQDYYDSGDWRGTWELDGGGCLMNQGVHGVDLLQWYAGRVAWVQSYCATVDRNVEVETQALAIIGFENGAHGVLQGATVCTPSGPVINEVYGSKGGAIIHDATLVKWEVRGGSDEDKNMVETAKAGSGAKDGTDPTAVLGKAGDTHIPQIMDMIECVRTGKTPVCSGEDGRHAVEVILAIYESARRGGEKIHLPLAHDFPSVGFEKI